ncbi:MAG: hypothetical protein J6K25_01495 [Thermoguttaceae bacterium]|nr:hypothetical protein [Thermoguttaceae bacterium]
MKLDKTAFRGVLGDLRKPGALSVGFVGDLEPDSGVFREPLRRRTGVDDER